MREKYISVIIPAYNAEETLDRAINSVLNQNYSNFEIVIIDDGSIDLTYEIGMRYSRLHDKVRIISQSNKGLGASRNKGLDLAEGELIALLDSDDEFIPGTFNRVNHAFERSDADVVTSDFLIIDESGKRSSSRSLAIKRFHEGDIYLNGEAKRKYCKREISPFCPTYFYKKSYLERNEIRFPEPGRMLEDIVFFGRLFSGNPRVTCIKGGPTYLYYMRNDSLAHARNSQKAKQALESILMSRNYFNSSIEEERFILEHLLFAYYISSGNDVTSGEDDVRETIAEEISRCSARSVLKLSFKDKIKWILISLKLNNILCKMYH